MSELLDLEVIKNIVCSAGDIMLSANLQKDEVFDKAGDANFVTVYDMKVQQFLTGEILKVMPDATFFGEEDVDGNEKKISDTGYTFIIDPIDGTTNFMFDYNCSCVSVGVAYCGKLVAGIVYNPYIDYLWYAKKGEGSFLRSKNHELGCNGKDDYVVHKLEMKDIPLSEGIACFGCARYNNPGGFDILFRTVEKIFYKALCIRSGGSAEVDLCRIASGSNAIYLELLLQPYDYAAAAVIIEEAGGVITQVDGSPIILDKGCSILAGTKKACEDTMALLEKTRAEIGK